MGIAVDLEEEAALIADSLEAIAASDRLTAVAFARNTDHRVISTVVGMEVSDAIKKLKGARSSAVR